MAEEVRFDNNKDLSEWLKTRTREDAVIIAIRAAMRVVPSLAKAFDLGSVVRPTTIILPPFRNLNTVWIAAVASTEGSRFTQAVSVARTSTTAALDAYGSAALTAGIYGARAYIARSQGFTISHAIQAVAYSAATYGSAASIIWNAVSADANVLVDRPNAVILAQTPLWPGDIPDWATGDWTRLRDALLSVKDEDWGVWTDWYEARLRGDPINEALETARVLIPNKIWGQGPKIVNAEIRRLIEEHRPSREDLEQAVSPQPVLRDGALDVAPNDPYDAPDASDDLAALPHRQRAVIRALLAAIRDDRNISPAVVIALEEYDGELLAHGPRPMLGLLNDMHQIVRDEYLALRRENLFENKGGLRRSFLSFTANHKTIAAHFPLDATRERVYRDRPVDRAALDIGEIRSLADEFVQAVDAVAEQGFATPDFVRVSHRIADDVKRATYMAPTAPVDAMDANRALLEPPELSWADRAIIKGMSFSDRVRSELNRPGTPQTTKGAAQDAGLILTLSDFAARLARAIFGG